jgi:uncharacterized protein YycO
MLNYTLLQAGDILFYRVVERSGFSAKFIGWGQRLIGQAPSKHDYCHVAIVEDQETMFEARWPKTKRSEIDLPELASHYNIEVWRVKNISEEQIQKVLAWANRHLGEWYDLPLFLLGAFDFKKAEVCSTFVQKAFQAAGIVLSVEGVGHHLTTPDELMNLKRLKKVA